MSKRKKGLNWENCHNGHSHNVMRIPENGIGVEISSRVEPKIELLLSVAFALAEHICV